MKKPQSFKYLLFYCFILLFNLFYFPVGISSIQNQINQKENKAEIITTVKSYKLIGKPKYNDDFKHFDYVNPNAPKGGMIKLSQLGTYDNFNRDVMRGVAESRAFEINETLFVNSHDDVDSYYPLLATSITYSNTYNWAEVTLNEKAHFSDGVPVTAHDVEFTFNLFMTQGVPQYRTHYAGASVKALDDHRVRFEIPTSDRSKLLHFVGGFAVFAKHFWQNHKLSEPLTTPPIGSAPYIVKEYQFGKFCTYERDKNYWAKDLPSRKGQFNFDIKRIDYYLESNIELEAFKAGEFDFIKEPNPKNWHTQYNGKMFDANYIIKNKDEMNSAGYTNWLAINIRNPLFKEIKVREALALAYDFAWLNKNFYYNSYNQPASFFEKSKFAAQGKPSEAELKWLNKYKELIPKNAFGDAYKLPLSDGSGYNRENLQKAKNLLKEAGFVIKNNVLVNEKTNEPFKIELLLNSAAESNFAIPFKKNLEKLGITMKINSVDAAQFKNRRRTHEYDMIAINYPEITTPSAILLFLWGSKYTNSLWNPSGLHSKAIDEMIEKIGDYVDDEAEMIALAKALDRTLTHEYVMIPMSYEKYSFYANWNKFSKPTIKPDYSIGLDSWWYDADKASKLPKNN